MGQCPATAATTRDAGPLSQEGSRDTNRRAAERRRTPGRSETRVRPPGRRCERPGDRGTSRCRHGDSLPALPAALGSCLGGVPTRDRRVCGRSTPACWGARTRPGAPAVVAALHGVRGDQALDSQLPCTPATRLSTPYQATSTSDSARCFETSSTTHNKQGQLATTSTPWTFSVQSPTSASPPPARTTRRGPTAWSPCSSTVSSAPAGAEQLPPTPLRVRQTVRSAFDGELIAPHSVAKLRPRNIATHTAGHFPPPRCCFKIVFGRATPSGQQAAMVIAEAVGVTACALSAPPAPRGRAGRWSCPLERRPRRRGRAGW
jgi:hypothetical protein